MSLRLPDRWVWDFWFAQDGPDFHIFFLQAPRSLGDPDLRHVNATIGHAVSRDLRAWTLLPDALTPGPGPAWDDRATWTGCVIRHDSAWWMFYTGISRADPGLVQRIGLATSPDLIHWAKHPANPIIEPDATWYERAGDTGPDQAWRDPWVFWHDGAFHALITARANRGPADGRGVIGHARSTDLVRWDACPPLTEPGEFFHLEVVQLVPINGRNIVLYTLAAADYSAARLARPGVQAVTGVRYLVGDAPLGPYVSVTDAFVVGDPHGSLYAGKLIRGVDGQWQFMAFHNHTAEGAFIGAISDPMAVTFDGDRLLVHRTGEQ